MALCSSDNWVPMCKREEWKDVQPVLQDDGPEPVVPISYTPQFTDVMNYFRAILARDERSPRALSLTAEVLQVNCGNYTVWHFRRNVLQSLNVDLEEELALVDEMADNNSKNYQLWYHRRWIAEKRGIAGKDRELEFTERIFSGDSKNYHAWSHRQWVLQNLGGWEKELEFCDMLLDEDVHNNSAWNQRYFVITRSPLIGGVARARDAEVAYCKKAIGFAPDNESAWRYLAGLFKGDQQAVVGNPEATSVCIRQVAQDKNCVQALNFLLDLLCWGFRPTAEECSSLHLLVDKPEKQAMQVCERLARVDPMRVNYWTWRWSMLKA